MVLVPCVSNPGIKTSNSRKSCFEDKDIKPSNFRFNLIGTQVMLILSLNCKVICGRIIPLNLKAPLAICVVSVTKTVTNYHKRCPILCRMLHLRLFATYVTPSRRLFSIDICHLLREEEEAGTSLEAVHYFKPQEELQASAQKSQYE